MENLSSIELKLTAKGKYYWEIKLQFVNSETAAKQIVEQLRDIDRDLQEKFPNNCALSPEIKTRFNPVDPFSDID